MLMKIARSCKSHSRNFLQHFLLRSIELLPTPISFAWRNFIFRASPALFFNNPLFKKWEDAYLYFVTKRATQINIINLTKISVPTNTISKKIAIQVHIFYCDLVPELIKLLKEFPEPFDLLVSTPHKNEESFLRDQFQHLPKLQKLQIIITPNRGRDLGPLLFGFGKELLNYEYFLHIHTKKSVGANNIGNAWRDYLWNELLGTSNERIPKILQLLEKNGLVYPQKFSQIDVQNCQWGENLAAGQAISKACKLPPPPPGYIEFPVGSMFWAQSKALKPLLEKSFGIQDFEEELGQTDCTIMHTIERLITHTALAQGYSIAVLQNPHQSYFYP